MRINLYAILSIVLLLAGFRAFAQFEGSITYHVDYESKDATTAGYLSMLPNESVLTIKDARSRFEQSIAGGGSQVFVTDAAAATSTLVMNFMGQAFQVTLPVDSLKMLRKNEALRIAETSETKEILGMVCDKALAISGNDTTIVYFNKALHPHPMVPQLAEIEGIPMEYTLVQNNIRMHFTAKKIVKTKVDPSIFEVSEDIKEITFSQFAKSFALAK
jgi:hypothetical protein